MTTIRDVGRQSQAPFGGPTAPLLPPTAQVRQVSAQALAPAPAGARVGCYLVDAAISLALGAIAWWAVRTWAPASSHPVLLGITVVVEVAVAMSLARAASGRTPGGLLLHCTAARVDEPMAPGLRRQAVRTAVQLGLQLTVIGPLVSAALSREGRDWADRASGLVLLDTRAPSLEQAARGGVPAEDADAHRAFMPQPQASTSPAPASGIVASAPGAAPSIQALDAAEARLRPDAEAPRPAGPQVVSFTHQQRAATPAPEVSDRPAPRMVRRPATEPVDDAERTHLQPRPAMTRAVLVDTGERLGLASTLVVGRAPVAGQGELAVPLADDSRSLSRTHLRIGSDASGVWAEDVGSANGTALVVPGGQPTRLPGGRRVPVPVGAVLVLGDRRLTVLG